MDKTYWLTDKDEHGRPLKILPPGRYTCYECRKYVSIVFHSDGQEVRPCPNCSSIIYYTM
jgi:ribosomal protein S27E